MATGVGSKGQGKLNAVKQQSMDQIRLAVRHLGLLSTTAKWKQRMFPVYNSMCELNRAINSL